MKRYGKTAIALFLILSGFTANVQANGTQDNFKFGYVNVEKCIGSSKYGKRERNAFEALKKQLDENLEKADKELADLAKKLEDQDYLDGLSPQAEDELKQKFQKLSQEFVRYRNQYYQLLNQANVKLLQNLNNIICDASDKVRKDQNLKVVFNDEAIFAVDPADDVSDAVIKKMDERFESENKDKEAKKP